MGGTQARVGAGLLALGLVLAVAGVIVTVSDDDGSASRVATTEATDPTRSTGPATTSRPTPTTTLPAPTTTRPTPTTVARSIPTTAAAETPQAFFALLGQAFASGDENTLYARLHPLVLTRYGADQCRTYLASISVPRYAVEVLEVKAPEPWDWTLDGRTDRLPSAIPVRVHITEDGTNFRENEAHLVMVGNQARWFTDCGTPI